MSSIPHVIAEAGTNHNGCLKTAENLVDVACAAGADSVKFQIIYPEGLYLPRFRVNGGYIANEVYEKRRARMLSDDEYRRLSDFARERGLPLSASVFDARGLALLEELDAPYIKIASCDLNNTPLLKAAAAYGRKLIVSTGMASIAEIEGAVHAIASSGRTDLVLMHCVSIYPCTLERMNLSFIRTLQAAFGFPVGLSDHTESSLAAAMGVSMGVAWIEKHFTYSRAADGFDHAYAMEPEGLSQYIRDVRQAAAAARPAQQKLLSEEATVKRRARRGIYAARPIRAGEIIAEADLLVVRPEGPLALEDCPYVVGSRAVHPIAQFEAIQREQIQKSEAVEVKKAA